MRRLALLAGGALALCSTLALAAPESLLPETFNEPAPSPAPRPAAPPAAAPAPFAPGAPRQSAGPGPAAAPGNPVQLTLPSRLPSIAELEKMDAEELDELFGLKPKFDIPAAARRDVREIGIINAVEGGFAPGSLANQPAALVRAAIQGVKQPLVSRWGHILLRRALASRLDAPAGMDPVDFAAMRASLLNRMGEAQSARALVQDVDSANYRGSLAKAAFDAYLATGDILGICPVAQLQGNLLKGGQWDLTKAICRAYAGGEREAERELDRALYYGVAPRIDVLLAQRYAGAAGEGRKEVNIEWDGVDELNPWRFSLARALGVDVPEGLRSSGGARYAFADVAIPAVPLADRVAAADTAGAQGVLSSAAMVDLYSQLWADDSIGDAAKETANTLREAYVARDPTARITALRSLWGQDEEAYGRQVLTAYAAARLPVVDSLEDDAPRIVASMLTAGLDRNALRWGQLVPSGSQAWALLVLAQPNRNVTVSSGAVGDFVDDDASADKRKAKFLVAGLAGLGRLDADTAAGYASDLGFSLSRQTLWSRKIDRAAALGNPALVALLAGLGMQGESWDKMTPRHLFHIVRGLNQVGLDAEARMIAAEAVARG